MTQGFSLPKTDAGPSITINPNGVFYFYARARNGTVFEAYPNDTGGYTDINFEQPSNYPKQPGPTMGVGVYGFISQYWGTKAITDNWNGLGSVSGVCGTYTEYIQDGYACPTGADANMEEALTANNTNDFWLSIWSVGAPNSAANCDISSDSWYCVGYTAGYNAASEMVWAAEHDTQGQAGAFLPSYAILESGRLRYWDMLSGCIAIH
jgi:hypothetical protein